MQKKRISGTQILAIALFLCACVLGIMAQRPEVQQVKVARAQFNDATPLGGKGVRLLLERLDYKVQRASAPIDAMPKDARVWLLLDPVTGFPIREARLLLRWVQDGGTLIWALSPNWDGGMRTASTGIFEDQAGRDGVVHLGRTLGIGQIVQPSGPPPPASSPLPTLGVLSPAGASIYWNGVSKATGSLQTLKLNRPHLEIAGSPLGPQIARLDYGKGRVIIIPDAMLFTNYALAQPDNAVLVTNLIRAHMPPVTPGYAGTVYFDERQHGESTDKAPEPTLLYYLGRPPLSYAMLQLLGAALLLWALYGRRLGAPVPLPEQEPVTRASHFAAAMGSLFQKVHRPQVAGAISGEEFRRVLSRRMGMSPSDTDAEIAARAAELTGLPPAMIDRLLLQAKAPSDNEAQVLNDVQEMEIVLRSLNSH